MLKKQHIVPVLVLAGVLLAAAPVLTQANQEVVSLQNPIKDGGSIQVIIGRIIEVMLGLLGAVTLFMFVDGGFTWLTSAGQADRVKKGLLTMLYAVVGLFVIFAAYGILSAIITDLGTPG